VLFLWFGARVLPALSSRRRRRVVVVGVLSSSACVVVGGGGGREKWKKGVRLFDARGKWWRSRTQRGVVVQKAHKARKEWWG
jgi:hypothetical protein